MSPHSELWQQLRPFIIIVIISEQMCACFINRLSQLKSETVTEVKDGSSMCRMNKGKGAGRADNMKHMRML